WVQVHWRNAVGIHANRVVASYHWPDMIVKPSSLVENQHEHRVLPGGARHQRIDEFGHIRRTPLHFIPRMLVSAAVKTRLNQDHLWQRAVLEVGEVVGHARRTGSASSGRRHKVAIHRRNLALRCWSTSKCKTVQGGVWLPIGAYVGVVNLP